MKRRFLAFVCCFSMLVSLLPCSAKANGRTTNVNLLETPEEVAEVFYRQNASLRKSKGVTAQDQQNEIRKRVIVESAQTLGNTYGAVKTYYYTVGGYQILLYDSADQAELAVTNLKKDYPGVHIFQDIPVTLEEAARDGDADVQVEIQDAAEKEDESETETEIQAFDGIHMMGMDKLKEDAKDWSGDATVAVIDSGIDEDHPWFTTRLDRKNSVNLAADGLGKDAYNDPNQGHGTHVAGIVTQATPVQVKIMAVRVFDLTGSASYTTITLGVDYAVQHNADVINMSLGFEILPGFESDDTDLMDEAFARALKAGTTVCVASGNEYTDTARSYPASSRWTIAVGSLEPDKDGNSYIRSDFSNNGTLLDFAAPGRNIFSAWIGEGETTEIASGTSMATPHLAAAAAYVKLKHPDYNQREVYSVFRDYAVDLGEPGKDTEFGYGYVDFTNYAAEDQNTAKKYQAITAPAQINKTMNDLDKPFTIDIEFSRGNGTLSFASTDEKVAKDSGESRNQVQRFVRLTNLVPELLDMVDEKKISFNPAVELSYLDEKQQQDFLEAMDASQNAPSLSQAIRIKKLAQQGEFDYDAVYNIMNEEKKSELDTVTIKNETLRKYFPRNYTPRQMESIIIKLLDQWQLKKQQAKQKKQEEAR